LRLPNGSEQRGPSSFFFEEHVPYVRNVPCCVVAVASLPVLTRGSARHKPDQNQQRCSNVDVEYPNVKYPVSCMYIHNSFGICSQDLLVSWWAGQADRETGSSGDDRIALACIAFGVEPKQQL
jgi:hypothetical protein